jgi:hypothetical protein
MKWFRHKHSLDLMATVEAAGATWYWCDRRGPGCWHRGDPGGRCLSIQGLINEHSTWVWLNARSELEGPNG